MKTRRILVATDLTPASLPAFREAVRIALGNGADLILAHAYEIPGAGSVLVAPETYDEIDQKIRTDAEQRLSALVLEARQQGVGARTLLLYGDPYEAIENAAAEQDVDLVIMGTHGRTGVSRFFLGSVASRLIATSPCPVLTVREA
jgi:nucleotide-binding universal stress UspA family protein